MFNPVPMLGQRLAQAVSKAGCSAEHSAHLAVDELQAATLSGDAQRIAEAYNSAETELSKLQTGV